MTYRILLVDDDLSSQEIAETILESKGHATIVAKNAREALDLARQHIPHCAVVDWVLGDVSGIELLASFKRDADLKAMPVLLVSARHMRPEDMAQAIEQGADDFLAKPYNPLIFGAKIHALLRRAFWQNAERTPPQTLRFQNMVINQTARRVTVDNKPVDLTYTEYELLLFFLNHRGEALDRPTLLSAISARPDQVFHQVIDKHIENLRKKIGSMAKHIETVRNVGYRLV
ncbi:MAG: response regulator transcription factor [Elusimicrobia bacterium]|nr:response regulator transcription factor [Elusimicrobiota bacterium]